jgi:polysaccharide export outer membrane protein
MRGAGLQNAPESTADKPAILAETLLTTQKTDEPGTTSPRRSKDGGYSEDVVQVNLKELLDSTDPRHNPVVYPGDIVKVTRAGIVYVVGAVGKPGGFAMKTNEKISVLQAIALSEGLAHEAAKGHARIIRTEGQSGARTETPIDLGKILAGKAPDPMLRPGDIVFVPNSAAKSTLSRGTDVAAQTLAGLLIFHW